MKIKINGHEVALNPKEVKMAKKVVSKFLLGVEESCEKHKQSSYYFTLLVVMHLISQEAIDNMDAKNLAMVMNELEKLRTKKPRI